MCKIHTLKNLFYEDVLERKILVFLISQNGLFMLFEITYMSQDWQAISVDDNHVCWLLNPLSSNSVRRMGDHHSLILSAVCS